MKILILALVFGFSSICQAEKYSIPYNEDYSYVVDMSEGKAKSIHLAEKSDTGLKKIPQTVRWDGPQFSILCDIKFRDPKNKTAIAGFALVNLKGEVAITKNLVPKIGNQPGTRLFLPSATQAEPKVYYAVTEGENFEKKSWKSTSLAKFKADPPENAFESYTVESGNDGRLIAKRDYATPSGDWVIHLTSTYGKDGRLVALKTEFVTFNGIDDAGENKGLTRCVRNFTLAPKGKLQQVSEKITDAKTGKQVSRKFWEPKVDHWLTLDDFPIKPKI